VSGVTVTPATGLITVAFGGPKASKEIPKASELLLSPIVAAGNGSIAWTCKPQGTTIANKYLPTACRP
jgi:type IV pilus assembly protein PilA